MRIKSWHFAVRTYKELIPRNVVQDPSYMETISKNITRLGITNSTLNYLRVRILFIYLHNLVCNCYIGFFTIFVEIIFKFNYTEYR